MCLSLFNDIGAEELYVEYGTAKNLRILSIHKIYRSLGPSRCRGLLFFYGLTGVDSITSFVGYGKVTAWNVWNTFFDEFTELFEKLSFSVSIEDLTEEDFLKVEYFVSLMYQHTKPFNPLPINDTRKMLFMSKGVSFDKLPPTQNVLRLKILRVLYQCMVWSNALVKMPNLPPVQDYGWEIVDNKVSFLWSTLPDVIKGCWDTFVKCNCRKGTCTSKCSCRKAAEVCTTLCSCNCFSLNCIFYLDLFKQTRKEISFEILDSLL